MFHEAESSGSKPGNETLNGLMALVSSGVSDIVLAPVKMTKEVSEVVTYTDPLGFGR